MGNFSSEEFRFPTGLVVGRVAEARPVENRPYFLDALLVGTMQ